MPWRTEAEIAPERQRFLSERRTPVATAGTPASMIAGMIAGTTSTAAGFRLQGVLLSRADVEWLLATHEDGRGPVDWADPAQHSREGLDLRGADLSRADLSGLPLARLRAGAAADEWRTALPATLDAAASRLEATILDGAHLEGALLPGALLGAASLVGAHMEAAILGAAHLEGADLSHADLRGADLGSAQLKGATLRQAHLEGAVLVGADLRGVVLEEARLDGAILRLAHLEGADLGGATLAGADLTTANLAGAFLVNATFDRATNLRRVTLADKAHGSVSLADITWGGVQLSRIAWPRRLVLGDERAARQRTTPDRRRKTHTQRLADAEVALRAYRQLAAVLRDEGLDEPAEQLAYRAWTAKRRQLRLQGPRKLANYLATAIIGGFTGYGYRPWRSVLWYLLIILGFAAAYLLAAPSNIPTLRWDQALILSISSFHGRGILTPDLALTDTYARLASLEAVVGFVIEIGFIATLTQRFFDK
jgi:uncharacterized protein YjbI with pentapeptide repeats